MSELKEKTAVGLFWAALNNGGMMVLNAVIGLCLANLLMPSDYGLVGLTAIFSAVAATLQESGFTSALTNKEHPSHDDYNSVFWFSSALGILFYVILFVSAPLIAQYYNQPRLVAVCRVCFLGVPLSAIGTVPTAILYKQLVVKPVTEQRLCVLVLSGTVGIAMAYCGLAYWSLVAQQLVYIGLQSLLKFRLVSWRPTWSFTFDPIRQMFGFSSKILATNVISQLSQNILTVIFGRLFPVSTVGNFTQGWKWNNMASSMISGMMSQVSQPVLSKLNDEPGRQMGALRKMVRLAAFLSFPLMLGLASIAYEFITLLLPERWADCVPILMLLCVGGAFTPVCQPMQYFVVSRGRSDMFMWVNIVQLALQIAIVLAFAHFGILTMVAAYSLLIVVWTLVWRLACNRLTRYSLLEMFKDTLPFLLAAMVAVWAGYYAASLLNGLLLRLVVKIVVAVVLYVGVMKLFGAQIMKECIQFVLHRKVM